MFDDSRRNEIPLRVKELDSDAMEPFSRFVRELSPRSRHLRFHGAVRELSPRWARRLVAVDQRSHVAWIVEARCAPGIVVAEARYASCNATDAEFAMAVADRWQGRGIGQALLHRLLSRAAAAGLRRLHGTTVPGNRAALKVTRRLGFSCRPHPDEPGLLFLECDLEELERGRTA